MMRWLVLALLIASCGADDRVPEQVPTRYLAVRASAGHTAHVGKVACAACHGDTGFAPPPVELCATCHAAVATPLHPGANPPRCQDCHAFGDKAIAAPCMQCHDRPQGAKPTVGAHADQKCASCHHPHRSPSLDPKPCVTCHAAQDTRHAGLRGCLDCHAVHEPAHGADQKCVACHKDQPRALHVDGRGLPPTGSAAEWRRGSIDAQATTIGHPKCTGCHQPHAFSKAEVAPCVSCHRDQPVLGSKAHTACITCHDPHRDAPRACTSCHAAVKASHPAGNCIGCHPIHARGLAPQAKAIACETCHKTEHHATARCVDCHTPHGPSLTAVTCARCHTQNARSTSGTGHAACVLCHTAHGPTPKLASCVTCHAAKVVSTARTGHASCAGCHASAAHAPRTPPPTCGTCHKAELASAPAGHQRCASCHDPHTPGRAPPACATCHAAPAASPHGRALACATCHRPHDGAPGAATPPACATCHSKPALAGLHGVAQHGACTTCHAPHAPITRVDRAVCLSCHKDRVQHEPTAATCAGCHPFRRGPITSGARAGTGPRAPDGVR